MVPAAPDKDARGAAVAQLADLMAKLATAFGEDEGGPGAEHGAIVWLQRFGGSLNLNLHLHVLVLDGLYLPDETSGGNRATSGALRFHDT